MHRSEGNGNEWSIANIIVAKASRKATFPVLEATMEFTWMTGLYAFACGACFVVATSVAIPIILALLTIVRQSFIAKIDAGISSILVGRVWHTRFHPTKHAFTYPLFMFGLDISALEKNAVDQSTDANRVWNQYMWPLSAIMNFRASEDHLTNGEGGSGDIALSQRVCKVIQERTKGKFQPTPKTHVIYLVTHLSYYGYCFNPVSFYYIMEPTSKQIVAVVGEVSNTPWIEQHSYVLHTESVDQVKVQQKTDKLNYLFPKNFHVSPFMEMTYNYDWLFDPWANDKSWCITTAMKRISDGVLQFTATMRVAPQGLNPLVLAWQLARFPMYCMIIQIWIHYEAFWLFVKGVTFQPHPTGAETTASRVIGNIMTPLFAFKDMLDGKATKVKES